MKPGDQSIIDNMRKLYVEYFGEPTTLADSRILAIRKECYGMSSAAEEDEAAVMLMAQERS